MAVPTLKKQEAEKQDALKMSIRRIEKLVVQASTKVPKNVAPYVEKAAPYIAEATARANAAIPHVVEAAKKAHAFIAKLPHDLFYAMAGLVICFFGGVYPILIASVEAFQMSGWDNTKQNCAALWEEIMKQREVQAKDDKKDDDNDGVADVDTISNEMLLTRKINLFLLTADPEKIKCAISGLWMASLAVIATLQVKFARTIVLGAAIGEVFEGTVNLYVKPLLLKVIPKPYHKWIPYIVSYGCKSIGVSFAWSMSSIITAVHQGIRGGFMFARHIMKWAHVHFKMGSFNDKDSYVDELAGGVLAFIAVVTQLSFGFGVPFPLNILLLPVTLVEWTLRFLVM